MTPFPAGTTCLMPACLSPPFVKGAAPWWCQKLIMKIRVETGDGGGLEAGGAQISAIISNRPLTFLHLSVLHQCTLGS